MLFTAMPERQSVLESVFQTLAYTFSDKNQNRWWFLTWALAPLVLLLLAASYLRGSPKQNFLSWSLLALGATVAAASTYLWPSLFLPAAAGVYYAYRARSDA